MTKGSIHQKQYVVRKDLDGTISVVGAISGDREWASYVPFHLCCVDKLGVQISSNDRNARWTHTSEQAGPIQYIHARSIS